MSQKQNRSLTVTRRYEPARLSSIWLAMAYERLLPRQSRPIGNRTSTEKPEFAMPAYPQEVIVK
jgi:hypothetical protein